MKKRESNEFFSPPPKITSLGTLTAKTSSVAAEAAKQKSFLLSPPTQDGIAHLGQRSTIDALEKLPLPHRLTGGKLVADHVGVYHGYDP